MKKYTPRKHDRFSAFLSVDKPGKEHVGYPFVCIESNSRIVMVEDKNGMACSLNCCNFSFETLET